MHWTVHILVGTGTGRLVADGRVAFALGILEHLALDALPHHDPEHNAGYVLDSMLGTAALAALIALNRRNRAGVTRAAVCCAAGSALPDLELPARLIVGFDRSSYIFPTHNGKIQHGELGLLSSLALEAALIILSAALGTLARWPALQGTRRR